MKREMYRVLIEYDEPEYPEGIQRTGRRYVTLLSARGASPLEASLAAIKIAAKKGYKQPSAVWAHPQRYEH